jgi:hypothetical protein
MERKKLSKSEKEYLKGIIGTLALEKLNDREIQVYLKEDKGIDIERITVNKIRLQIQRNASKWYNELRASKFLYIAHFKERIDTTYRVEKKLWDILNDPGASKIEQVKACTEIRNNEMFLSNLYDIARYLTERIEKDGPSTDNEPLSTERETESVRSNLSITVPDIE